jgi:integrase
MRLDMAKPTTRKGSSFKQFRRQTPNDIWRDRAQLIALGFVVTREVHQSLRTRDPQIAKTLQAQLSVEWDAKWNAWREALKHGPRVLTQKEVFAIIGAMGSDVRLRADNNPGEVADWKWVQSTLESTPFNNADRLHFRLGLERHIAKRYGLHAVAATSLDALVRQFETDLPRIFDEPARMAAGDYREGEWLAGRPKVELSAQASSPFTFIQMLDNWKSFGRGHRGPAASSVRQYSRHLEELRVFVGHDEPCRVTLDCAQRYLQHIKKPKANGSLMAERYVRDTISNLATLYAKAIKAQKLSDNPFKTIVPDKSRRNNETAKRPHPKENAIVILKAARLETDAFRRWGPFLMAYGGMRVSEAGQLRKDDVEVGNNQSFIHIRNSSGHTKSNADRLVPVHQALIAEGFLEFVGQVTADRLFPRACLDRHGNRQNAKGEWNDKGALRLSVWVNNLVLPIESSGADPNHGWRHRFQVEATTAKLDRFVINRIVGHEDGHVSGTYQQDGFRDLLWNEMMKFPAIDL